MKIVITQCHPLVLPVTCYIVQPQKQLQMIFHLIKYRNIKAMYFDNDCCKIIEDTNSEFNSLIWDNKRDV